MNGKLSNISIFLILLCLFIGCQKTEKKEIIEIQQNNNIDVIIEPSLNDIYSENYNSIEKVSITDFYFNEIMNSYRNLDFHRGEYKVIELFGDPLEINIQQTSFYFEGGMVTELHFYVYDDFTHYYYVFNDGLIYYVGFFIEKKLDRLKKINIGDTSNKLLLTFSDKYYTWENVETIKENISYYTDPVVCEIQFIIKDTIIQKIFVNFVLV